MSVQTDRPQSCEQSPKLPSAMRPRKTDRHLPSCVYQKHGAYWLVKAGKWHRLGPDLATALAEYARRQQHPTGGMAELIEEALPGILKGRAESTQQQYKVAARKLQSIFAEFAPHQVEPRHVAKMRRALADTPNMANRTLTVLRMIFSYAVEEQIISANPCAGIKRLEEATRDRLVDPAEFAQIRACASKRLAAMMDIAYLTGQRLMDVVTIHRADLTDQGIRFKQGKTGAKLTVRWTPQLREAVERAKALGGKINALTLFHGKHGTAPAYGTVRDEWQRACAKAGVADTTMRDIRAMSATHARQQGKDATALLGHTSPQMTKRYLRDRETPVVEGPVLDSVRR